MPSLSKAENMAAELQTIKGKLRALDFYLTRSFEQCMALEFDQLTNDDLDKLEALTARFERTIDVFTSQYLRLIDAIEAQEEGTFIDALNRAEKRELIDSSHEFRRMKILRNKIAHEYATAEIDEIAERVLRWTPLLLDALKRAENYVPQ
jgi:uncharacterized protein YutE (UPF0331/DUF86 family)